MGHVAYVMNTKQLHSTRKIQNKLNTTVQHLTQLKHCQLIKYFYTSTSQNI